MSTGFQYMLAGMAVIALLFAGLSLLPTWRSEAAPPANPAAGASSPALPLPATSAPTPAVTAPAAVPSSPSYTFQRERTEASRELTWLFTKSSVVLRKSPNGEPYRPPTVCFAPLTILPGTRLWPIRTEGDWVMVRSPSQLLGWIPQSEVSNRAPIVLRKY